MAFIISKSSIKRGESRNLYYLVENYREGKKIRRRTIYKLYQYKNLDELFTQTQKAESEYKKLLEVENIKLTDWLTDTHRPMFYYIRDQLKGKIKEIEYGLDYCQKQKETIEVLKLKYKL